MYSDGTRFLIVTASIGSGHTRAAEAVADEIKRKYSQAEIEIVDFMSSQTAYLNGFLKEAYLKILSLAPDMYQFLYSVTGNKMSGFSVQGLLALAMKNDMAELIKKSGASVIIFTHPFPCAAAAYLKRTGQIDALLCGVITDFAVHQLWVYNEVDLYFVAHSSLKKKLAERGISEGRIFDTGIPITAEFANSFDREKIMQKLAINNPLPIVLVMGGGLGLGGIKATLLELDTAGRDFQIMVVSGKNQSLKEELSELAERSRHNIRVWGYSNNVAELMAASDVLVTKPGALTISEALAMKLPLVLSEPIPGQEKENAAFVEKTGAAIWVKDIKNIAKCVDDVLGDAERLSFMRRQAAKNCRPAAAEEIAAAIMRAAMKEKSAPLAKNA
jgi:processive 1,2-diacylglycerol beta-glucosyltransferase